MADESILKKDKSPSSIAFPSSPMSAARQTVHAASGFPAGSEHRDSLRSTASGQTWLPGNIFTILPVAFASVRASFWQSYDKVDVFVYYMAIVAHIVQTMEEDYLQKLGMKIRKFRLEQELSQDKLALMIGSTKGKAYISRIERGKSNISINVLYRIASALGVKVNDLIDF